MSFSEFTRQDIEMISRDYAELRKIASKRCADERELEVVQKAFEFANEAHKNVRRRSGEPYMIHPIAVARIVVEDIGLGYKSIAAALLHDVVEDTDYTVEDIRNLFGDKIASLVDGLTKIKNVLDNEDKSSEHIIYTQSLQAENFKRILLTLNDDVRVVLIKLADRLHNCSTIEYMPEHKRDKILSETMFIFIPLAHRLGLYEVKSEMENIWLRYKEPEAYAEITRRVNQNVVDRDKEINDFIAPIEKSLRDAGFKFKILKRVKTPYSIWRKMQIKNVPFEQVYDLYAVRIIFDPPVSSETERDMCYHIFSIITGIYRYNPGRLRDWVKAPKSNGYEALHCTLLSNNGHWIEVQIRSRRMDDIAEKGIAAHWAYKREGFVSENESEMDKWLEKVKDILIQKDFSALELLDIIHNDLTAAEIVVFTPKGEQKTVSKGATALDFAYLIHSAIGNRAIAAKVNMKLEPLSYQLKTGDQIEIIYAESGKPKKEWLGFLKTRHAINAVVEYFKGQRDTLVLEGAEIFRSKLAEYGYKANNDNIKKIMYANQLFLVDELYFRLALGLIPLDNLPEILAAPLPEKTHSVLDGRDSNGSHYVIASCCSPIPGDSVVGFRSPDGTITIHKKSCPVAEGLATKHGDWVVSPRWDVDFSDTFYPVRLSMTGIDRVGLLSDITQYISLVMGVNMRKLQLGSEDGIFEGFIELLVHDRSILDDIVTKLRSIDGINDVIRTDI